MLDAQALDAEGGLVALVAPTVVAALIGVPLAAWGLPRLGRALPPVPSPPRPLWGAAELLVLVALVFVFASLFDGLTQLFLDPSPVNGLLVTTLTFWTTAALGYALVVFARVQRGRLTGQGVTVAEVRAGLADGLGLRGSTPVRTALGAGLAALLLAAPLIVAVMFATPLVFGALGHEVAEQAVLQDVLSQRGASLALAFVLAGCVGPALEEVLFRGFLQPVLVAARGEWPGIVLTSIAFAMLHGVDVAPPIFVLSLLLGWVRVRTGRLAAPILVHAAWNSTVLALTLLAP